MSVSKKYRFLDQLDGSYFIDSVRVRVLQKYAENGYAIDMILIDQKGTTINAKIMNKDVDVFVDTLKENAIYDITRFNTAKADKWNRPTMHPRVMFLHRSTRVEPIEEITGFPVRRTLQYTGLDEAMHLVQKQDNTYLLDVIGVVVSVSTVTAYSSDSLKRVIAIQDKTGTTMKIVLWNEYAADFEELKIQQKSVLGLASVAINRFKGFNSESLTSGKFTQLFIDPDNPNSRELKKGDNYSELEDGVILADWREHNRKSLLDIVSEFNPENPEGPYTCIVKIIGHTGLITYLACKGCNTKASEKCSSIYCKRCKMQMATHTYCRMEASISDDTSTEVVTLFGNQLESILKMKLPNLLDVDADGAKSVILYEQMRQRSFVFELNAHEYSTTISLSVSRIGEVVNTQEVLSNKKGRHKITNITKQQLEPVTPTKTYYGKRKTTTSQRPKGKAQKMDKQHTISGAVNLNLHGDGTGTVTEDSNRVHDNSDSPS